MNESRLSVTQLLQKALTLRYIMSQADDTSAIRRTLVAETKTGPRALHLVGVAPPMYLLNRQTSRGHMGKARAQLANLSLELALNL